MKNQQPNTLNCVEFNDYMVMVSLKKLRYSLAPYSNIEVLSDNLYFGAQENCNKCLYDRFWTKQAPEVVDTESELLNLTRPLSKCSNFKYGPSCKRSGLCTSTFDRTNPVVLAPEVCPIVYNNIPKYTQPGYHIPSADICNGKY